MLKNLKKDMSNSKYKFFLLFILLTSIFACSSSSTQKPVTNIQISPSKTAFPIESTFKINISSRYKKPSIKKIDVFINNKLIHTENSHQFSFTIDTKDYLPGKYTIKTIAYNKKGNTGENNISFNVVSDIVPNKMSYKIIETLAHNTKFYTQGFEFYKGILYEGTGNYNKSYIYEYSSDLHTINKQIKLDKQYFGEGITILNDKIYQLSYKSQKGFVYDVNTFALINEFTFESKEGWGLCNDGQHLIMSDGTSQITYLNPNNFKVEKTLHVSSNQGLIKNINELEYVDGVIYANIWTTETIVKFDAQTGKVLSFINMSNLLQPYTNLQVDVLNGIAYNKSENLFYITGKWWPYIFKVQFEQ